MDGHNVMGFFFAAAASGDRQLPELQPPHPQHQQPNGLVRREQRGWSRRRKDRWDAQTGPLVDDVTRLQPGELHFQN